mmetsp:Transcript_45518/g.110751  ORF Transcript_45518/g.110751 Transcript_45518/m.110751 type:complete len:624 (-) Transcript_45518:614-2485(-)
MTISMLSTISQRDDSSCSNVMISNMNIAATAAHGSNSIHSLNHLSHQSHSNGNNGRSKSSLGTTSSSSPRDDNCCSVPDATPRLPQQSLASGGRRDDVEVPPGGGDGGRITKTTTGMGSMGMPRTQTLQSLLSASTASSSNESSTLGAAAMHHYQHHQPQHFEQLQEYHHQEEEEEEHHQRMAARHHKQQDSVSTASSTIEAETPTSSTTYSSQSVYSLPSAMSIKSSIRSDFTTFGMDLRRHTNGDPNAPKIDKGMRTVLEPHIRKARLMREKARLQHDYHHRPPTCASSSAASSSIASSTATSLSRTVVHDSIASSVGVPYTRLRTERPFLYDTYTHPLHEVLAETLGVQDLSQLHNATISRDGDTSFDDIMAPLKNRELSMKFQESYDSFVTSFCIPLLHSIAMKENLFHSINSNSSAVNLNLSSILSSSRVNYRYQAFPSLRVVRPGDASHGPVCDTALGHSVGYLRFHVPLTPSFGTNALYTESYPGKEDWHPLSARSVGLGYVFDGARCIHFNMENTTDSTLVALDFVVAIYSDDDSCYDDEDVPSSAGLFRAMNNSGEELCHPRLLEDHFSLSGPGYYDEAVIDVGQSRSLQIVAKKRGDRLLEPDERVGFPFETY